MSKIVFFSIPAHGHTNPTLAVVKELIDRGNEVFYYSYSPVKEKIEALGAHFINCDAYDRETHLNPRDAERLTKDLSFSAKILVDATLSMGKHIQRDLEELQPDCIVADSMAIWGKGLAYKLRIPYVCSNTTFAFNRYSAKIMKHSFGETLRMLRVLPKANREVARLSAEGYPFHNAMELISSDEEAQTIVYTSPAFQPSSETFPDNFSFVGPSIRPIQSVPQKGENPLLYISLGTVLNDSMRFYQNCMEALKNTPCQVILSVGEQINISDFEKIPENFQVKSSVDQIGVLSVADGFLTHCGMNSVNEALYFGVPMITYPQTAEQEGVARRVQELNAGLELTGESPSEIRKTVETLLTDPAYQENAKKLRDDFRLCPGASGAADKIESVCRK